MNIAGIISVPTKKFSIKDKLRNRIKIREQFNIGFDIIIAEIAYTAEELIRMPLCLRKRILKKAEKHLKNKGVETLFCSISAKNILGLKTDEILRISIPDLKLFECVSEYFEHYKSNNDNGCGYIIDSDLSSVDFEKLILLSKYVSRIFIITDNERKAEELTDTLCFEYGICIDVADINFAPPQRSAFVINSDNHTVRIGSDIFIDGMEIMVDLHGYTIDAADMNSIIPFVSENMIDLFWVSGKKRLTLQKI